MTGTSFGFPAWYRDTNATALALCTEQRPSPNASAGGAPMCFPIVPDPAGYVGNIGGEIFYYNASTILTGANGFSMLWEGAIEATYAIGTPIKGDEITFSRIRIVMDTQAAGTYTVTHPYGQEVFPDVKGGKRAVFFTVDIGVSPGVFTGALAGGVGPFLEWDQNVANPTSPFGIDPASGAAFSLAIGNADGSSVQFVGDPNFTHTVTGSPFLQNFVRVDGPPGSNLDGAGNDFIQTSLFTVLGERYTIPIPQPLVAYRSNLSVDEATGMAHVDVFADTTVGAKLIATSPNVPTIELFVDSATGEAYGQAAFSYPPRDLVTGAPLAIGSQVTVTNVNDNPHSTATGLLADIILVPQGAVLAPDPTGASAGILTVLAETSMHVATVPPMKVLEFTMPDPLDPTKTIFVPPTYPVAGQPWIQQFQVTVPSTSTPWWEVHVASQQGGLAIEPVVLSLGPAPTPGPTAASFAPTTQENTAVSVDATDPANLTATVLLLAPPANGTAAAVGTTITYTPKNLFAGPDSFTYVLTMPDPFDATKTLYSNEGRVDVTVNAVNNPPVAVGDGANTTAGVAVLINVAANDTDVDGTVVPASVVIVRSPTFGTVVNNANGTVTYTPSAGVVGVTDTFDYTIADDLGAVSAPGTVSVVVSGAEVLTITRAEWTVSKQRYRVVGTSSVFGALLSNRVTLYATCAAGTTGCPVAATVAIGSAPIDVLGNFTIDVPNPVSVQCNAATRTCPATELSTGGGSANFPLSQK